MILGMYSAQGIAVSLTPTVRSSYNHNMQRKGLSYYRYALPFEWFVKILDSFPSFWPQLSKNWILLSSQSVLNYHPYQNLLSYFKHNSLPMVSAILCRTGACSAEPQLKPVISQIVSLTHFCSQQKHFWKSLDNNVQNQFFWACKNEHP